MKPFDKFPEHIGKNIRCVLTDIDDTLTVNGRLPAMVFSAMERLQRNHIRVIPITGRPAGWCDHMARMWPVDAVVGENGAFYFLYDYSKKRMIRRYWKSDVQRNEDREKLDRLRVEIMKKVSGSRISADQAYREADLAIDYCEDVPPLSMKDVEKIVQMFEEAGAQAKISSIHVNGWFGNYDKLAMTRHLFKEIFHVSLSNIREQVIFTGDSPNDVPMFTYFPHSIGVANIMHFKGKITRYPAWITKKEGGYGFAEMVENLLA